MTRSFSPLSFVKDSTVIAALSSLGVAGAFLLDVVVAAKFGLGYRTDALFIALGIPQLVWFILTSSGTRVLTPVFTQILDEDGEAELWRLFSLMSNLSLIVLPILAGAGVLLSPLLMAVAGVGLDQPTATVALQLNRILFLMLIPAGLIQIMKAALNARHRFSAPAAATFLQYGIIVLAVLLLEPSTGIASVAIGYVLSMVGQALMLGIAVYMEGCAYSPLISLGDPVLKKTGRLLVPLWSGEILAQSIPVIERALASFLPPGSVSALSFAGRILRALDLTIVNSMVVAILPRLSSLSTGKDFAAFKRFVSLSLRVAWAISIPLAIGVMSLSAPIVTLLFQRGAFDQQAAALTGTVLSLYVVGFPVLATVRILVTSFHAMQDTTTPFFARASMLVFNLSGDLILISVLGVFGLALATSIAYGINCLLVLRLLRRKIGHLNLHASRYLIKSVIAGLVMGIVTLLLRGRLQAAISLPAPVGQLLVVAVAGSSGAAAYLVTLLVLRTHELQLSLREARDWMLVKTVRSSEEHERTTHAQR